MESLPQKGSEEGWNVLVTTYNLAQGDGDRKFFRKIGWDVSLTDFAGLLLLMTIHSHVCSTRAMS